MTGDQIAREGLVYLCTVGSTVHGLHLPSQDDRDEMGIAIEPPEVMMGLSRFESHVERTQPKGVRSGPGDLDRVIYSARKYAALAAQGNPTVLILLFAEARFATRIGADFIDGLRGLVTTQEAGPRFLGYLIAQREKLTGERGGKRVKRQELIDAHGYDTKFAMHALRLGMQGCEFLRTGSLTLPMSNADRDYLLSVRRGERDFNDTIAMIHHVEADLRQAIAESSLPRVSDRAAIDRLLVDTYRRHWSAKLHDAAEAQR